VCVLRYREAGRVYYLSTVRALHQGEAGVAAVVLVGLLAHLAHGRQGQARLHTHTHTHTHTQMICLCSLIDDIDFMSSHGDRGKGET